MNPLNRISLGISATIFTLIGLVLFINPIEHIGSFSWLISCGFFLISLSRFFPLFSLSSGRHHQAATALSQYGRSSICSLSAPLWLPNAPNCLSSNLRDLVDLQSCTQFQES